MIAPLESVEAVSDLLADELGAQSVAVEDSDAGGATEQALFGEPGMAAPGPGWNRSAIKAMFADEAAATAAATLLLASPLGARIALQGLQVVPDQDWVQLTQSQFAPVEITPSFWIVPSWHQAPAQASRVLRLDPGLAFGTGTHPTTRMCLRWIARHVDAGVERLLDYGCGSGVLAIAAALHGARGIDAVDIDPAAVAATRANAAANGVALSAGLPDAAVGRYAAVLANILANPLKLLAPLLCGHLDAGAPLVLAGVLERQRDELRAAYAPWLALEVADAEEGWILLTGRLPGPAPKP